jgi:hypothetical protein
MTIEVFDQLSEDEKLEAILNGGRVISETRDNNSRCFLYFLGSFYASVQYQTDTDEMTEIKSFETIGREERIKWKVLRALPGLHAASRRFNQL